MEYAVTVDIGGTNIKGGLVDRDGEIIYRMGKESEAQKGVLHLMGNVSSILKGLIGYIKKTDIAGIGIGSAGLIDYVSGKVIFATPNIPFYTGMNIKDMIEREFCLKTFVDNDVNMAGIGEAWKGAGIGTRKMLCITVGTGIGGCILYDGVVERGISGSAGVVGHMIIKFDGLQCNCGNRGCYEQYASTAALTRNFNERLKRGETSSVTTHLKGSEDINARMVFNAARNGDTLANKVINEFIEYLGIGIISLTHILNPEIIIIGGGISNEGNYLTDKLSGYVDKYVITSFSKKLKIVPARLCNDAGLVGAARTVFDNA